MSKRIVLLIAGLLAAGAAADQLAYVAEGGAAPRIVIIDVESAAEVLSLDKGDRPAWSPDGTMLAFIGNAEDREALFIADCDDAGGLEPYAPTLTDGSPVWSPDGRWVAFADNRGDEARLRLIEVESGEERRLSGQAVEIPPWSVVWSPDGTRLAFTKLTDYADPQLYLISVDGGNELRMTDAGWHVVYAWTADDGLLYTRDADLWLMDADDGEARRLTETGYCWNPALSPDRTRVVFNSTYHLYLLDLTDGAVTQLTTEGRNGQPVWSPDGSRIAFVSDRDGDREVFVIDADGDNPRQLTDNDGDDHSPAWRPE